MKIPIFSEHEKKAILGSFLHIALSDTENDKWNELHYSRSFEVMSGILNREEWKFLDNVVNTFGLGDSILPIMQMLEEYKMLVGQLGIMQSLQSLSETGKDWYIDNAYKLIFADGGMTIQEKEILDDIFGCIDITEEKIRNIANKMEETKPVATDPISTAGNLSAEQGISQKELIKEEIEKECKYAVLLERGYKNCNSGNLEDSIEYYSQAIKLMPTPQNWTAYFSRAQVKAKLSPPDYEGAELDFGVVIGILRRPDSYVLFDDCNNYLAQAYGYRGEVFFSKKNYQNSINDYTSAIKYDSNNSNILSAYFNRGKAHGMLGMNQEAINDFDKVIKEFASQLTASELAEMFYSRGLVYANMGELSGAYSDLINSQNLGNTEATDFIKVFFE